MIGSVLKLYEIHPIIKKVKIKFEREEDEEIVTLEQTTISKVEKLNQKINPKKVISTDKFPPVNLAADQFALSLTMALNASIDNPEVALVVSPEKIKT